MHYESNRAKPQSKNVMNPTAKTIDFPAEKLYTIGTVSKLTGVGAITLRAWERRYGLIRPVRKESGHRLYTRHHIDQINRITALANGPLVLFMALLLLHVSEVL